MLFDQECPTRKSGKKRVKEGYEVNAIPPLVSAQIDGIRVCGERGGPTFMEVERNQNMDTADNCPAGLVACGTNQIENTWCVTDASLCPVTKIQFIEADEKQTYEGQGFTVRQEGGKTLAFSKDSKWDLPIISTKIARNEPCLDPFEEFRPQNTFIRGELAA